MIICTREIHLSKQKTVKPSEETVTESVRDEKTRNDSMSISNKVVSDSKGMSDEKEPK